MNPKFIRPFTHRLRDALRYYRCVVEFFGPGSNEARRVRRNIRTNLIASV